MRGNDLKIGKILGVDFFMTGRINLPKCYVERPFSASRHAFSYRSNKLISAYVFGLSDVFLSHDLYFSRPIKSQIL